MAASEGAMKMKGKGRALQISDRKAAATVTGAGGGAAGLLSEESHTFLGACLTGIFGHWGAGKRSAVRRLVWVIL